MPSAAGWSVTSMTARSSGSSRSPSVSSAGAGRLERRPRRSSTRRPARCSAAVREVRELARGLHPPVRGRGRGWAGAVEALAERAPLPGDHRGPRRRASPPRSRSAAYYVIAEGLTNVARYAEATDARVTVAERDGRLVVTVSDNGRGGADPGARERPARAGGPGRGRRGRALGGERAWERHDPDGDPARRRVMACPRACGCRPFGSGSCDLVRARSNIGVGRLRVVVTPRWRL